MRFRDRIKGRPQSKNVEVRPKEDPKRVAAKQNLINEAMSNPRTLSKEPIKYNEEKNNKDRAKGAMGAVMRTDPKQTFRRMSQTKDPKPAKFFKHTTKDN